MPIGRTGSTGIQGSPGNGSMILHGSTGGSGSGSTGIHGIFGRFGSRILPQGSPGGVEPIGSHGVPSGLMVFTSQG